MKSFLNILDEFVELFMFNNTLSEVESVIEELVRGWGLEPFSACNISC